MSDDITVQFSKIEVKDENEKSQQQTTVKEEEKSAQENENKGIRKQRRGREGRDEEAVVLERGVKGHVKWYNVWQHYGFIGRDDDPSADVFVHQSGIAKSRTINPRYRTLDMDEKVVFDVVAGKGGGMKKAVNVTGPDGEKVRGCYFFEQYLRDFAYQEQRRNYKRGEARSRYLDTYRKGRKYTDRDERSKRRNYEKSLDDNEENKIRKQNRSASTGAKEKRHGERRRNAGASKEAKVAKSTEKEQEVIGDNTSPPAQNEVSVDA